MPPKKIVTSMQQVACQLKNRNEDHLNLMFNYLKLK
jgi:hypothetical protein